MSTIWEPSAPADGVARPYTHAVTSNRKERRYSLKERSAGVVHIKPSWGSDDALCGRIGAWSEAVLDQSLATCRRCKRIAASCDTHPKDGDVKQAPLVSGAVPKADAPNCGG